MKKTLLAATLIAAFQFHSNAQCNSSAHDWGSATFGVSPNPNIGENFLPAALGVAYADVVYILCPTNSTDIDPTLPAVAIDSIRLDSITLFNGLADVQLSSIGLNVTCNNNGESPNPCMFYPGNAYCGDIAGIPTVAGLFDVKIFVTVYFSFFSQPSSLPYSFEGYTLDVSGPIAIAEVNQNTFTLLQNSPNPAAHFTNIKFETGRTEDITIQVTNLIGGVVMNKLVKSKKGENNVRIDTSNLETGIYLYSIQTNEKKLTRKMIVQQ